MPFLEDGGPRIHYRADGPPDAPVLVFCNSLGTDLSLWEPQLAALARYGILRYDTRGHGRSALGPPSCTIEDLGRDVLRLLDARGVGRAHFCGLSIGGQVGQWLGAHAPERVRSLALCNTAAHIGTPEAWNVRIEAVRAGGTAALLPGLLERWFSASFLRAAPDVVARAEAMVRATGREGYTALSAAVRDNDARGYAGTIRVPTLVVAGRFDPVTTPADGRALAAAIPGARYAEVPAAHLSNIEAAAEFNAALSGFLTGLEQR
jgi:3-oxoadipate enol-lactonase